MSTLTKLTLHRTKKTLIISTVNAISQRIPPKEYVKSSALLLHVGKSYDRDQSIKYKHKKMNCFSFGILLGRLIKEKCITTTEDNNQMFIQLKPD